VIEHVISAAIADFPDYGLSYGFKDQTTGSAKRSRSRTVVRNAG
jgi:hypothetical protein